MISYAVNAVLLITIGIVVANILAETGIFSRLSSFTDPLCRVSGLSDACILSIIAMGVNATAGKSMLAGYYHEGEVREQEVIPVLIMGAFPVVVGESLFRVQLPAALVLLGPVIGGIYTGLNLFSSGIQAFFALLYSRRFLADPGRAPAPVPAAAAAPLAPFALNREVIISGCRKAVPTLRRIVPVTLAALVVFSLLSATGVMDLIAAAFDPVLRAVGLPRRKRRGTRGPVCPLLSRLRHRCVVARRGCPHDRDCARYTHPGEHGGHHPPLHQVLGAALPLALRPVRCQGGSGHLRGEHGRKGGHDCAGDGRGVSKSGGERRVPGEARDHPGLPGWSQRLIGRLLQVTRCMRTDPSLAS